MATSPSIVAQHAHPTLVKQCHCQLTTARSTALSPVNMDQTQWATRSDYNIAQRYDTDGFRSHADGHAYDHQQGQFELLGPPDAPVALQPTNNEFGNIGSFVRQTNDEPYAAGHRPRSNFHGPHAHSFPGPAVPWIGQYQELREPGPSGHSSTTASDSAYQSLIVTSGPSASPYGGQAIDDSYNPFPDPLPEHVELDYTSHVGTESVLSEPGVRNGPSHWPRGRTKTRSKSLLPPCHCGKILKNPSDAQ